MPLLFATKCADILCSWVVSSPPLILLIFWLKMDRSLVARMIPETTLFIMSWLARTRPGAISTATLQRLLEKCHIAVPVGTTWYKAIACSCPGSIFELLLAKHPKRSANVDIRFNGSRFEERPISLQQAMAIGSLLQ